MTNLVDYRVTDLVTQVLAEQYNRIIDSALRGELSNSETLASDKTLIDADFALQIYAPTAARTVTLPAVAAANHPYYIINTSAFLLTVKDAGATIIDYVYPGRSGVFVSSGAAWKSMMFLAGDAGGWVKIPDTWTYVSASQFSVPGDQTTIYLKGLRLRFRQGGSYKYGIVASSAFTSVTTVTIVVNSDYTLANAAITANEYSFLAVPQGFPDRFNYAATVIVSDTITAMITGPISFMIVDTEGALSTDNLSTINGGANGDVLVLAQADNGRDVTVIDGTGNLRLNGNCVFTVTRDTITLIKSGTLWLEMARSLNG